MTLGYFSRLVLWRARTFKVSLRPVLTDGAHSPFLKKKGQKWRKIKSIERIFDNALKILDVSGNLTKYPETNL